MLTAALDAVEDEDIEDELEELVDIEFDADKAATLAKRPGTKKHEHEQEEEDGESSMLLIEDDSGQQVNADDAPHTQEAEPSPGGDKEKSTEDKEDAAEGRPEDEDDSAGAGLPPNAAKTIGVPTLPPRPSLGPLKHEAGVEGEEDFQLNDNDQGEGGDEEDVSYLRPAMIGFVGEREEDYERAKESDYSTAYERLPDDDTEDVFKWARATDTKLSSGAMQPLWIHSQQMTRQKATLVMLQFRKRPGLFMMRERKTSGPKDKARYALTLTVGHVVEHHLVHDMGTHYAMRGSTHLPSIAKASDLSSIVMQVRSKFPTLMTTAIIVPRLSRIEIGGFPDFFHGKIDRFTANKRLEEASKQNEGFYLVRVSPRIAENQSAYDVSFVLSVVHRGQVEHHILRRIGQKWTHNGKIAFPSDCRGLPDVLAALSNKEIRVSFELKSYVRRPPQFQELPMVPFDDAPPPLPGPRVRST